MATPRNVLDYLTAAQHEQLSEYSTLIQRALRSTELIERPRISKLINQVYGKSRKQPAVVFSYSVPAMLTSMYSRFSGMAPQELPLPPVTTWAYQAHNKLTHQQEGRVSWDAIWEVQDAPEMTQTLELFENFHLQANLLPRTWTGQISNAMRSKVKVQRQPAQAILTHGTRWMTQMIDVGFWRLLGYQRETEHLKSMFPLLTESPCIALFSDICWVLERPERLEFDDRNRLHSLTGPAVQTRDGFEIYAVHGIRVDKYMVLEPHKIKLDKVDTERNIEVRRVLIDLYGMDRYLQDSGALIVDEREPHIGVLYRRRNTPPEEDLQVVKVRNSTPEPDGTYKDYFLKVPPFIQTARAGVAWTFGLRADQYKPERET